MSDDVVEQRILEQSVRLPEAGAVTGWAAARLHGAAFFDGLARDGRTVLAVPLVVPRSSGLRRLGASTVVREPLLQSEVTIVVGIPVTVAVRAVFDEMRRVADPREAVVALDMAAAAELVSLREMRAYLECRRSWRRSRRVAWAVDLLDPDAGLVGEYDGATHRQAYRHARDIRREDLFRRAGLEYVTITGPDLRDQQMVADRLRHARGRALAATGRARGWTLDPPEGWWSTDTTADRLARRDWLRSQGVPA